VVAHAAGHTDIAPTVLGLLGKPYRDAFWGRDLFHDPDGRSRLLMASSRSMWLAGDGRAVRDEPYVDPILYSFDKDPAALTRVGVAGPDEPLLLDERALSKVLRVVTGPGK
jgi:hypothetical protein